MRFSRVNNPHHATKIPNNRFSKLNRKQRLRKTFKSSFRLSSLISFAPLNLLLAALFAFSMSSLPLRSVNASNPATGNITPTGPTQQWDGTAVGTAAPNESACVEGVNCDTFTLNVAPGDYTGKIIQVKITWTNPANDYDLYIHKDSNAGPIVGSSADGAPQTSEAAAINPTATGTGVYTVHVLYFAVTPSIDQYHGTATVQNATQGRNATT